MIRVDKKTLGLIFSGVGVVGVGVTSALSAIRTPVFEKILKEEETVSKASAIVRAYWPSFISGAVTIASIIFAEKMNLKELAVATSVTAYLVNQRDLVFKAINAGDARLAKSLIKSTTDEKMEKEIHYIVKAGPSVEETGRGDLLCYEAYSGRWFRSTEVNVNKAIEELNRIFDRGEYVCINDFYELLGLETSHFGFQYGWAANPDYYDGPIEFEVAVLDEYKNKNQMGQLETLDEPVLIIEYLTYPMECWQEV